MSGCTNREEKVAISAREGVSVSAQAAITRYHRLRGAVNNKHWFLTVLGAGSS